MVSHFNKKESIFEMVNYFEKCYSRSRFGYTIMLSLKGVYKTYRPKKGIPVKALVNVSVDFQEKGLVFILGKSGSGKSTMLNIIGGLDKAEHGEIIIKGKSSNQFKNSDFDNYRNTFVGFVFQEYNLLNDFNIGKNIALALELQGKKSDKDVIEDILSKVDLVGYENRKVNELSGGQKQRVAIARALIKQPEIILADEPTGALDSVTGHQVFDILRKLGQEKLVIVVSHDRETAEEYADRIIEMKDGEIVSDTSKATVPSEEIAPGVLVNKNVVHFSEDHQYSLGDFDLLKKIQENNNSVIITKDANLLSRFVFNETDQTIFDVDKYDGSKLKFISSKLKNVDSLKIGASGLKFKKVRLFFTILLSFIAVAFFALTDTLSDFDSNEAHARTLQSNNIDSVTLKQRYETDEYDYGPDVNFSKEQVEDMRQDFPNASLLPLVEDDLNLAFDPDTIANLSDTDNILYNVFNRVDIQRAFTPSNYLDDNNLVLISGNYPSSNEEFLVTSFELQLFKRFSFPYYVFDELDNSTSQYLKPIHFTSNDILNSDLIIGKSVDPNNKNRKISGVIGVDYDDKYLDEAFLEEALNDYSMENDIAEYLTSNMLCYHYFSEEALDELKVGRFGLADEIYTANAQFTNYIDPQGNQWKSNIDSYIKEDSLNQNQLIKFTSLPLANDEIIMSIDLLFYIHSYQDILSVDYDTETYDTFFVIIFSESESETFRNINELTAWNQDPTNHQKLVNLFASKEQIEITNNNIGGEKNIYKLAGIYFPFSKIITNELDETIYTFSTYGSSMTLNETNEQNYSLSPIQTLLFSINNGANAFNQYTKLFKYKNGLLSIYVETPYTTTFRIFGSLVVGLQVTFLVLGSILAGFSALLMMNFIATSISYKRHDIGILRGLGARKIDVIKIFTFESLIIAAINIVLAVAATIPAVYLINGEIAKALDMNIVLLGYSFRQFGLTVLIAIGSALLASTIPVLNIARKKPIDAINNR